MLHCDRYAKGAVTSRALHINSNELRKPRSRTARFLLPQERQKGLPQFVLTMNRIAQPDTAAQYPGRSVDTNHWLIYRGFNVIESETAPCLAVPSHCLNEPLTEMGARRV